MRRSKDMWVLTFLFLVLFAGMLILAQSKETEEDRSCSSYNADPLGTKAFYTLLGDRLGHRVRRLKVPFDRMPREAEVLVVVEPTMTAAELPLPSKAVISEEEADALRKWVTRGGTVVFASTHFWGVPTSFRRTRRMGQGYVYAFDDPKPLTNRGMRSYGNAVRMAGLVTRHASRRAPILFDEYHHGIRESRPLWAMVGPRVKTSLIVLLAAGLLAVYGQGRRFGAVRRTREEETVRPGSEFVFAVGRLYRRAKAAEVAAEIIADSFLHKVPLQGEPPVEQQAAISEIRSARDRWAAGQKPTDQELLRITNRIHELERKLGLERFHA